MNKKFSENWELQLGSALFIFLTMLYITTDICFFFNVSTNKAQSFFALALTSVCLYLLNDKNIKKAVIILGIALGLILLSIWGSGNMLDTSYDGNGYRKIMTGLIKEGWNPIYQSPQEFNRLVKAMPEEIAYFGMDSNWFWMDVYPKSLGILGGGIYLFTGNIESGKYFTLVSMLIVFLLYDYYLKKHIKVYQSVLISLCLALNPVSMTQLRTFYVDAFLGNIILISIVLIFIYFEIAYADKIKVLLLIGSCIIWSFNIKFNGIFYIGCNCLAMWLILLFSDRKSKNYRESKRIFVILGAAVICAIMLGYSPYVTNITRYNELLPGITGSAAKATGNFTESTKGLNTIELFFVTIFSRMGDFWSEKNLPLKIPFTISESEIVNYNIHAPQFGTFGMFFSGLILLSFFLLLIIILKEHKKIWNTRILRMSGIFYIVTWFQCIVSPVGLGGLRYVSHFYIVFLYPFILMCYLEQDIRDFSKKALMNSGLITVLAIAFLNISPYFKIYKSSIDEMNRTEKTLEEIAPYTNDLEIALSTYGFYGMLFNLRDKGINLAQYELVTVEELGENCSYTCGWQVRYILTSSQLPR